MKCCIIQVTWYRNSIKLFETDRVLMTVKSSTWTVKLTNVTSNMFGNYTCVAGNSLGTVQETVHVSGKVLYTYIVNIIKNSKSSLHDSL